MAISVRNFRWRPVTAGVRTQIYQAPLLHGAPVQWLEFGHGAPNASITFSVIVYSATPPFYLTTSGTGTVWLMSVFDVSGIPDIPGLPWDSGYPLWLLGSPWTEVYVTTNRNCMARLDIL